MSASANSEGGVTRSGPDAGVSPGGGAGSAPAAVEPEAEGLDPGLKLLLVIPIGFLIGLLVLGLSIALDWSL